MTQSKRKKKILMLTAHDWANTGYRFSKCLEMLGFDVTAYKGANHVFQYPKQMELHPSLNNIRTFTYNGIPLWYVEARDLARKTRKADIIHFIASTFVDVGIPFKNKKVVVQHGGHTYRANPALADFFNKITDATIIQCPDLLGLGSNNEHLIYYPVQLDVLKPEYKPKEGFLRIGHFPSNPKTKGTEKILKVIEELSGNHLLRSKFGYVGIRVLDKSVRIPWEQHINRVRECDVLIETCNPESDGKTYGEWGNAAIEAAALGKIVVTNSLAQDIYAREYGECALHIANTPEELQKQLEIIIKMSDQEILKEKKKTYQWVKKNHSMEATAKRLWDKIYSKF